MNMVQELIQSVRQLRHILLRESEWSKSRFDISTKSDLEKLRRQLMASQDEVIAQLKVTKATLEKVVTEVQTGLEAQQAKIEELTEQIKNQAVKAELLEAASSLGELAGRLDAINPDAAPPAPEPEPVPA